MFILNNSRAGGTLGVLNFIGSCISVCKLSTELYYHFFNQNCILKRPVSEKYLLFNKTESLELYAHFLAYDFKILGFGLFVVFVFILFFS